MAKKTKPFGPTVDAQGRTLFEVEVAIREVRTFYFWTENEDLAEKAAELAEDFMADGIQEDEQDIIVRAINERDLPDNPVTYIVSKDKYQNEGVGEIRPTQEVRDEEVLNATGEEKERLERAYRVRDTLTLEMFPHGMR